MKPREFGKYTLLVHMGKGGMASVYRARNNEDGGIVAIKVFTPSEERPPEVTRRIRDREVRMLLSVQHPNIVRLFETGQEGDEYYYTMEFVDESLQNRLRRPGQMNLVDEVRVLRQAANALQAIHRQGIVHRDIKPGNILLDEDEHGAIHVKVTDLGIARNVSDPDVERRSESHRVAGTPKYLSPEQIQLKPVDGRADIFSLGVVAYELFAGKTPFYAETSDGYLQANVEQVPEDICRLAPQLPPFLKGLVEKMLAKDPEGRYDSDTLARDLELTEQHLISEAPLVDHANANSIFYVPAPEEERPVAAPERKAHVASISWVLVFLLAVGGVVVWALARPQYSPEEPPEGDNHVSDASRSPQAQQILKEASETASGNRHWRALTLLEKIKREDLKGDQEQEFDALRLRVQETLAAPSHRAALKMLQDGRTLRAEVLLKKMKAFFPDAGPTRQLAQAIGDYRASRRREQEWQGVLARLTGHVRRGEYVKALDTMDRALVLFSTHADNVAEGRGKIAEVLTAWAKRLVQKPVSPTSAQSFFEKLNTYKEKGWPQFPPSLPVQRIHFGLGKHYHVHKKYEEAVTHFKLAIAGDPQPFAGEARRRIDEIERQMLLQPIRLSALTRKLEREGFKADIWRSEKPEGAQQEVKDSSLLLSLRTSAAEVVNALETARPVQHLGFQMTVDFTMSELRRGREGNAAAGVRVEDREKNAITILFATDGYKMVKSTRKSTVGASLRKPFGDESRAWHSLGLHFMFDRSRVAVLVDGKVYGIYPFDLGNMKVTLFLKAAGDAQCRAAFKNLVCGHLP